MRETLFQMQEHTGQSPFPTTIGHVTKAITFNTPHGGAFPPLTLFACFGCTQAAELTKGSGFMSGLGSSGRNPQTSGGFTDWTVIGSVCDIVVTEKSAIDMDASHAVVYARGFKVEKFKQKCYDHSQALHDKSLKQDNHLYNCSKVDPDNSPCGIEYKDKKGNPVGNWKYTKNGLRGLSQLYYSVTGRLPSGAERVGSSRHLWLLSTAATAWALLRR